jgi:MEMO1 family protein
MNTTPTNQRPISIRPTAVAGSFYPGDVSQLNNMLDEYLATKAVDIDPPKAIIAPHAGYIYSGLTAASVYSNVAKLKDKIKRVVLLGPTHRVYVQGIALASNTHFATPLGNIPIDTSVLSELESKYPFVQFLDVAHEQEHSLEVHLPFLQKVLNDFNLIPLLVGDVTPEKVATIINELWGGDETLIVISSDLSHFLDYETASKKDNDTTKLIENFDYKKIGSEQACGCMPMRGLLKLAQDKNLSIQTLDYRNSGDTAGTKDRVVGYGAYALFESKRILNSDDKEIIFNVIHKSIKQGLESGNTYKPDSKNIAENLKENYAVFITLKLNGQLRGCIGTTEAHMPLIDAVAHYAHAAAFSDPRFKPLTAEEYKHVEISLSILTPAVPLPFNDEQDLINKLRPNIDGIIISKGHARATFLPVVWESIKQPAQFISELKRKAGMSSSDCPDKAWRYTAEYYS